MLIPYDSKALMGGGDSISTSPFTLVFKNAGLAFAASFMNAVILTSVISRKFRNVRVYSYVIFNE